MNIADKIRLSFLLIAALFLGVGTPIFYLTAKSNLENEIFKDLKTTAYSRACSVKAFLEMGKKANKQLAKSVVIEKYLSANKEDDDYHQKFEDVARRLENTVGAQNDVYDILVLNKAGIVVASSEKGDVGKNLRDDPYLLDAIEGVLIEYTQISPDKKINCIAFPSPIFDTESTVFLGVVVTRISMEEIEKIIEDQTSPGKTGDIYLIDDDGYMVTPSRFIKDTFLKQKVDTEITRRYFEDIKKLGARPYEYEPFLYTDYRGVRVLGVCHTIPETGWCLLAEIDESEAFAGLAKIKTVFVIIVLFVLIAAWFMGDFVSRIISKPIHKLHKGAEIIGKGNLDYKVATNAKDEIGQLSRSFDKMTEDLKETTTSVKNLNKEIAERKRVELALRGSEQKYRTLFESSQDAIMMLDKEKFFDCNKVTLTMFACSSKEEFVMKHPSDLSPPKQPDGKDSFIAANEHIEKAFTTGSSFYEWMHKRTDGTIFPSEVLLSRLELGDKKFVQALVRDISERKRLEAQLQQAQKMKAIGTLAGGIAHDFNNLLMGIQGRVSLMSLDTDSYYPHSEHLKEIENIVKRAADLTSQLLGFARGGKYEVKPTDLNELIEKSSELFGRTKKEITIHRNYQKDIWTVDIDRGQIEQVLLNLYVNAWQAMPQGGDLYLRTENVTLDEDYSKTFKVTLGEYVKTTVTDTGIGMDEKTQKRIFEPFFTAKGIGGGGTGLGLASAYGIIRNHRGFINVYSEMGKGATFTVYLPAMEKEVPREKELSKEVLKGTGTVLLVDDEEMIIEVGETMLKSLGYKVLLSGSGKEAIKIYKQNRDEINIVILDMVMPDMGGGETYDILKKINPNIKVLLSSGYSIDGEATEIMKRGCDGFIQKPYNMKQLSKTIRGLLDKK